MERFGKSVRKWKSFCMGGILTTITPLSDESSFANCAPATVSPDLSIHIPVIMYNNGSYWADLQHTQDLNFILSGVGQN